MFLSRRAAALLSALLLTACGHSSVAVDRQPDASLLLPCIRPAVPPQPYTDNDVAQGYVNAVVAYLECEARHDALVTFVRGGK